MNWKQIPVLLITMLSLAIPSYPEPNTPTNVLSDFETRAAKFNSLITLPQFETMTNQVQASTKSTIRDGNAALDIIAATDVHRLTFGNTVRALDDLGYQITLTANRLSVIKETSTD